MAAVPRLVALMCRVYNHTPNKVAKDIETYRKSKVLWPQDWEGEQARMRTLIKIALDRRHEP